MYYTIKQMAEMFGVTEHSIYLQGLSLGFAYIAPIGMQNLFVINSAMRQRLRAVKYGTGGSYEDRTHCPLCK